MQNNKKPGLPPNPWGARNPVHALVLAGAIGAGLVLCAVLAAPFLSPFTWAATLAILFTPVHRRLEKRIPFPNAAALLVVLLAVVTVALPLGLLFHRLLLQASAFLDTLGHLLESGALERSLARFPAAVGALDWIIDQVDLSGTLQRLGTGAAETAGALLKGSVWQLFQLALAFYFMFYLVRDRHLALRTLRALSPLTVPETNALVRRLEDTVRATLFGTFAMAATQGLLGGLMFWWLDLPAPLFWGLVMAFLAIFPILGAFLVWIPAAAALLLAGAWGKALLLLAWGALVVGTIDNILGPILVGHRLRLHTLGMFVSLVGGLFLFGSSGLVLGPLILSATLALLGIWRRRTDDPGAA